MIFSHLTYLSTLISLFCIFQHAQQSRLSAIFLVSESLRCIWILTFTVLSLIRVEKLCSKNCNFSFNLKDLLVQNKIYVFQTHKTTILQKHFSNQSAASVFIVNISFSRCSNLITDQMEARQHFAIWTTDIMGVELFIRQSTVVMLDRRVLRGASAARIGRQRSLETSGQTFHFTFDIEQSLAQVQNVIDLIQVDWSC